MYFIERDYVNKGKFAGSYFYNVYEKNPHVDFIYLSAANV